MNGCYCQPITGPLDFNLLEENFGVRRGDDSEGDPETETEAEDGFWPSLGPRRDTEDKEARLDMHTVKQYSDP